MALRMTLLTLIIFKVGFPMWLGFELIGIV
jgi:hypothetical protein